MENGNGLSPASLASTDLDIDGERQRRLEVGVVAVENGGDMVPIEAPLHTLRPRLLPLPRVDLTRPPMCVLLLCAPSLLPLRH